jgi:hypothetical protein
MTGYKNLKPSRPVIAKMKDEAGVNGPADLVTSFRTTVQMAEQAQRAREWVEQLGASVKWIHHRLRRSSLFSRQEGAVEGVARRARYKQLTRREHTENSCGKSNCQAYLSFEPQPDTDCNRTCDKEKIHPSSTWLRHLAGPEDHGSMQ